MLEAKEITVAYGLKAAPVLRGLSFQALPGRLTGLLGPNGSGKSTMLLALGGLLPPRAGSVRWQGEDIYRLATRQRAQTIAAVAQRPESSDLCVFDFTLMGRYAHANDSGGLSGFFRALGGYGAQDRQAALDALRAVEAEDLAARPLSGLSGGEAQRVFVARALAQEAPVLLLDEPSSNLDPGHGAALFGLLRRLARERGVAVVAALHDINLAALFCDSLALLRGGCLEAFGKPCDVLQKDVLEKVYQTTLAMVAHPEYNVPQVLPVLPE